MLNNATGALHWLFIAAFLAGMVLMPIMMRLARRLGLLDRPAHRKMHAQPVPFLGGLGIFLAVAIALGGYLLWVQYITTTQAVKSSMICSAGLGAMLLGLLDDNFQIRARHKLLGQFLIACTFVGLGYQFNVFHVPGIPPLNLGYLAGPFTVLWILAVVNGINMIDGVDGLAGTVSTVMLAATAILAVICNLDIAVIACSLAFLGGTIAFTIWNWRPARIYMGDAGSLGLGMVVATSLVSLGQSQRIMFLHQRPGAAIAFHVSLATLVAAYPYLEIFLSVMRRWLRGKPVMGADRGHIHHRLINAGLSASQVSGIAALISVLGGGAAITFLLKMNGITAWLLCGSATLLGFGIHFCGYMQYFNPASIQTDRPHFLVANHFVAMQKIKLGLAESRAQVAQLINQTCIEFGIEHYSMIVYDNISTHWEWHKPADAHANLLLQKVSGTTLPLRGFNDQVALENCGSAHWTFEPFPQEDEIDIEYRVLMSEFMKDALSVAAGLPEAGSSSPEHLHPHTVSSHHFRHRKASSPPTRKDSVRTSL